MLKTLSDDPLQFVTNYRHILFAFLALGVGAASGIVAYVLNDPVLLVAGFFAGFAGIVTFLRIEYGLLVLVMITYIRLSDVLVNHHGAPSVAKFFVPVLLGFILMRWFLFRQPIAPWLKLALLLGGYGLVGFASLLYAKNPNLTERVLSDYAKDVLIALVVVMVLYRGVTLRRVTWMLIFAGAFLGTLTSYQFITGTFENTYWGFAQADVRQIMTGSADYRIAGPLSSNYYALVMLALVPIGLDRLWHENSYLLRGLAAYGLLVTVLSVVFTYSRGGFLAMSLIVGLMLLYKKLNPAYLMIGLLGIVVILPFLPEQYTARMATLLDVVPAVGSDDGMAPTDSSFRGRLSETLVAVQMFADHPIRGVGLANYNANYLDYSENLGLDTRLEHRSAHSLYLEILAESGMVGVFMFSLLIFVMFRGLWDAFWMFKKHGMTDYANITFAISLSLIGYLVGSIFLHLSYPRYFWLWIGIAFAVPNVARYELARLGIGTPATMVTYATELAKNRPHTGYEQRMMTGNTP